MCGQGLMQRTLTVGGIVTVQLASCLTGVVHTNTNSLSCFVKSNMETS